MTLKLTPRQVKALGLLLEGMTVRQTADLANVSERQIYRWLRQADFKGALHEQQNAMLLTTSAKLLVLAEQATRSLEDILQDPGAKGQGVASLTADRILSQTLKWRDWASIEERVTALEEQVREGDIGRKTTKYRTRIG